MKTKLKTKLKSKIKKSKKMKNKNVKYLETKKIDTYNQSEIKILNQRLKYVKESNKLFTSLNSEEKKILNNYKHFGYIFINLFLRNNYKFTDINLKDFRVIADYNQEIPDYYSITT